MVTMKNHSRRKVFMKKIKNLDIFGEAITLKHKGQSTVNTKLGGFLTVIVFLCMIFFTYGRLYRLVLGEKIIESVEYNTRAASSEEKLFFHENGIEKGDIKFGINLPKE